MPPACTHSHTRSVCVRACKWHQNVLRVQQALTRDRQTNEHTNVRTSISWMIMIESQVGVRFFMSKEHLDFWSRPLAESETVYDACQMEEAIKMTWTHCQAVRVLLKRVFGVTCIITPGWEQCPEYLVRTHLFFSNSNPFLRSAVSWSRKKFQIIIGKRQTRSKRRIDQPFWWSKSSTP